jgi:HD-GYP domain-containing protein (c-di-GMP phosphodiesterase class II)
MFRAIEISLFDLVFGLSEAVDLISTELNKHHQRVAYITYKIGTELKLPLKKLSTLTMAAALHDIGAVSLKERIEALEFEDNSEAEHQERGYKLLKTFNPFKEVAKIIRYHHHHWDDYNESFPIESNIIFLADRTSVLLKDDDINNKESILGLIKKLSGQYFNPLFVQALIKAAKNNAFWIELSLPSIGRIVSDRIGASNIYIDDETLINISKLFSRIIDFRSTFTATHSSGVAASAKYLGKLCNLSNVECILLEIAGYLHDIGKLAIPKEILEKEGSLNLEERRVIEKHTYFTYRILDQIKPLKVINEIACLHHERMNGKGYPFGIEGSKLSLCSRIMAVADVFTAITEVRPDLNPKNFVNRNVSHDMIK